MAYSADSTLDEILSDPAAIQILERHLPGVTTHPLVDMARPMSLATIASFPQANISTATLEAIVRDLRAGHAT
jgi:hypothetical protein